MENIKTDGGYEIIDFKKLETPIDRNILEPHIYEGTIILETGNQYCTWDKYGRCSNWERTDCFIKNIITPSYPRHQEYDKLI